MRGLLQATIYPERTGDFAFAFAPELEKGIAFEAGQAVLPYLFGALRVTALFATVDPRNARSIRLLLRLGFDEVAAADYPHGEVEPDDRVFTCRSTFLSPESPRP
jgi:RimJ/RimL family protein N-acetyltransferase